MTGFEWFPNIAGEDIVVSGIITGDSMIMRRIFNVIIFVIQLIFSFVFCYPFRLYGLLKIHDS